MILAGVVNQNDLVNDIMRNFCIGLSQCPLGIVGGHNDDYFSAVYH
jgi:hypothetical protein